MSFNNIKNLFLDFLNELEHFLFVNDMNYYLLEKRDVTYGS